jgi:hypothetical protein
MIDRHLEAELDEIELHGNRTAEDNAKLRELGSN